MTSRTGVVHAAILILSACTAPLSMDVLLGCYEVSADSDDRLIYFSSPDTIRLLPAPDSLMTAWNWDDGYFAIAHPRRSLDSLEVHPLKIWRFVDARRIHISRTDGFTGWSATLSASEDGLVGEGGFQVDVIPNENPVYSVTARRIACPETN